MKSAVLFIPLLLIVCPLASAELVELVTIYGPSGGDEFYHVCGPGDVNGDGYDDFIISSPIRDRRIRECENGYARLYFGGNPIDTSDYITIPAVCNEEQHMLYGFGQYCTKTGDMNGDGYPDFLIGDPEYDYSLGGPWNSGAGFVYWGGPTIDTLPGLRLLGETFNTWSKFHGLGDINGDSYNDIVASMSWTDDVGPVNIYLGGESPDSLPDFEIWPFFGHYPVLAQPAKIIGDHNGDGKDDIVLCNCMAMGDSGLAYMFFGSDTGFNQPDLVFEGQGGWRFGSLLSGCGDLNDDGFDEFMIAEDGRVFVYYGSQDPDTLPDLVFRPTVIGLADCLSSGGDLNQDGYPDIAVSYSWWTDQDSCVGRVLIYYGGEEMDTIPDIVVCGEERYQGLGEETTFPGDINGDGYPEFIASSEYYGLPGSSCVTIYTTNMSSVGGSDLLPLVREIQLTCYPNPFNRNTLISYSLSIRTHVKLEVFNLAGQKIASLVDEIQSPGRKSIMWEGLDERGQPVSSGIYFCKISCNNLTKTEKIALLR